MKTLLIAASLFTAGAIPGCNGLDTDPAVVTASSDLKNAACTGLVAVAYAAATQRGLPIDTVLTRESVVLGCRSLAERLPVTATVGDNGLVTACAQVRGVLPDLTAGHRASLVMTLREAGCPS